jgi:PTH1 family peptidyl-tRNA hydrolase
VGFLAVEEMAESWEFPKFRRPWRWRARVTDGHYGEHDITLVKPQTYMNRSGAALGPLLKNPEFDPTQDLLVVIDDATLPSGSIRIRPSGSEGGHNGLKSISGRLASQEYARLRIGVGPIPPDRDMADFVLDDFEDDELSVMPDLMNDVVRATESWINEGIETAMNSFNRRGS